MLVEDFNIKLNKYQSPITQQLLNKYPEEVQKQLQEFITEVPFIRNLISENRLYAKDLPKDSKGRIIIDLSNPHIVENMDYFRPSALHFKKYGCFTRLRPNKNPHSEFGKWIREERRRCWEGYVRPTDGEWVTGYLYYYLNYSPIMLTAITEGTNRADRVEDFPEFWEGIYWRFHYIEQARNGGLYNNFKGGEHCAELAKRGCSKSFSLASIMAHNFTLGENEESHKKVMSILTAYTNEYLSGKDGTLSKFVPMIDFTANNTQFPRKRLITSPNRMLWQMGSINKKTGAQMGSLNQVMGVSSKDDESKLRGKRGIILFEEFGSFPRLINIYNVVRFGVEEGNYTFGQIYLVGTAGDDASDFFGAQELIYNPEGYHIYQLPNNWDKPNQGKPNFAFFFPAYVNRKGCYNKDGVSDVIKALLQILQARYDAKYKTTDPMTIVRVTADMPITPAEAMIKTGVSIFPTTDIMERILQLKADSTLLDDVYVADLVIDGKDIKYQPSIDDPIRYFPHKGNKGMQGAIEIFEMPHIDPKTNKAYSNRYIAGVDPYDNDESGTNSLGSILVLDLWTDKIVAEYTGRPPLADDFYEICRRMLIMYNAVCNYENNKKGLYSYFARFSCTYLLTDVLDYLKDRDMMKPGTIGTNTSKGTNASEGINMFARKLLAKWLISPMNIITKDENGNDIESTQPRLYHLRNLAFLQELASWNNEGNFDRVSAAGMLMLLREDRLIISQGDLTKLGKKKSNPKCHDSFFTDNYDKRFNF